MRLKLRTVLTVLLLSLTKNVHSKGRGCGVGAPDFEDVVSLQAYLMFSLECTNWEVRVRMSACRVRELGLEDINDIYISDDPEDNVTTLDRDCKFSLVAHPLYGEIYETKFYFDKCGGVEESPLENFHEYSYRLNFRFGGYVDDTISRAVSGFLGFSCWYNIEPSLFIGQINPNAQAYLSSDAVVAEPSTAITIEAYSDSELKNKLSADDPFITIPQYFYISAKVEGGGRKLILQAERCWATPNPNPENRKKKNLVYKGCPASSLASNDDVLIIENYQSTKVVLGIRTFLWPGFTNGQEIFVHCTLNICDSSDPSNSCQSNECRKRKRSLPDDEESGEIFAAYSAPSFVIPIGVNASSCAESLCEDICTVVNGEPNCACDSGRILQDDNISCENDEWKLIQPAAAPAPVIIEEITRVEYEDMKVAAIAVCVAAVVISLVYGLYFYCKSSSVTRAKVNDFLPPDEKC